MATKTAQDLVTRVLQKLTQLQPGEDPNAEDDAFVTDAWENINDNLRKLKVVSFTNNAIPSEVFEPLAEYVKEYLWQEYKGARENNAEIIARALRAVRAATASRYMGNPVKADYY